MSSRLRLVARHMSSRPAPQMAVPRMRKNASEIRRETQDFLSSARTALDEIAREPTPAFANVVTKYAKFENDLANARSQLPFYEYVSADEDVRQASQEAAVKLSAFEIEAAKRHDVYKQLKKVAALEPEVQELPAIDKRYLAKVLRYLERNGLDLPKERQSQLQKLEEELSEISIKFTANLSADKSALLFTRDELKGVPESVLDQLGRADDKYRVTFKAPEIQPVMKNCSVPETRKQLYVTSESRVPQNGELFNRAILLRAQIAAIMGYNTWADFALEACMAENSRTVHDFLSNVAAKAQPLAEEEHATLLALKREEDPHANTLYAWDTAYYQNKVVERHFQVDQQLLSEYFPVESTIQGMLNLFSKLMSLEFVPVELQEDQKWHDEATCYAVYQQDDKASVFKGYLYFDLYPRDNKYGHFAMFSLLKGTVEENHINYPVAALVCNFPRGTDSRPGLLYHNDVVTFFHELGHGIHEILGTTKYSRFSGTEVMRDFVELPSQLLENWTWDGPLLRELSQHYKTGESLPQSLTDSLIKSKTANQGSFLLRQLFYGMFDMAAHTTDPETFDAAKTWADLRDRIIQVPCPETLHGYNQFGHLFGGYDAGYYGYMWALVFAEDLWKELFKNEPLNTEKGIEYRDRVLAKGSSEDPSQLLRSVLGREPTKDAFYKSLGLTPEG